VIRLSGNAGVIVTQHSVEPSIPAMSSTASTPRGLGAIKRARPLAALLCQSCSQCAEHGLGHGRLSLPSMLGILRVDVETAAGASPRRQATTQPSLGGQGGRAS
jgi:hypothetical protein